MNVHPSPNVDLQPVPEPWDYNPSSWRQRGVISVVAATALFPAIYLGLYQWGLIAEVWDPVFGEQSMQVLDSDLSHWMRSWVLIPDAILGAMAYLGDILFALAGSTRRWQYRPWLVILFGIEVIPLGIVSAVLVFCQGAVVGAWCFLCLYTAVISLLLIYLAYDEVWTSLMFLHRVWRRSRSPVLLWNTIWGKPSRIAHEVGESMLRGDR